MTYVSNTHVFRWPSSWARQQHKKSIFSLSLIFFYLRSKLTCWLKFSPEVTMIIVSIAKVIRSILEMHEIDQYMNKINCGQWMEEWTVQLYDCGHNECADDNFVFVNHSRLSSQFLWETSSWPRNKISQRKCYYYVFNIEFDIFSIGRRLAYIWRLWSLARDIWRRCFIRHRSSAVGLSFNAHESQNIAPRNWTLSQDWHGAESAGSKHIRDSVIQWPSGIFFFCLRNGQIQVDLRSKQSGENYASRTVALLVKRMCCAYNA